MGGGDRVRRRVIAHGRVQGVFFRENLKQLAAGSGVAGWAKNRADGSMEACFEGSSGAVEELVAWCSDGPDQARVTRLDVIEEEPQGLVGFRTR